MKSACIFVGVALVSGLLVSPGVAAEAASSGKVLNYGGTLGDSFASVAALSGGGYVAVGHTESNDGDLTANKGSGDALVAKFNAKGKKVWLKNYGGTGLDEFSSVVATADGGFVAVGSSGSKSGDLPATKGDSDAIIAKFDAKGKKVWARNYGGSKFDEFTSVAALSDGGYVAVGRTVSSNGDISGSKDFPASDEDCEQGCGDALIARLDANGKKVWLKNFGGLYHESFASVAVAADGGYVAVGATNTSDGELPTQGGPTASCGSGDRWCYDAVIAKISSSGKLVWSKSFGDPEDDYFTSVAATPDGGAVAVGFSNYTPPGDDESDPPTSPGGAMIAKFDANGTKLWYKLSGSESEGAKFHGIAPTADGGWLAAGEWDEDAVIAKLDANGEQLWLKHYGGSYDDKFVSVVANTSGGWVAVGDSSSYDGDVDGNNGNNSSILPDETTYDTALDASIAKVDASGALAWQSSSLWITPFNDKTWTGKQIKPKVTVKVNGKKLVSGSDYTITYGTNKSVGPGTLTVKPKHTAAYPGAKKVVFMIIPKAVSIKKITVGKKQATVTWTKASAAQKITGYEINYRLKGNDETYWEYVSVSAKNLKKTIKSLKQGKQYVFRVLAVKKVSGIDYESAWSKIKTSPKIK
ncbi:MAG: fibronectin type III domain-containing protein [Propionibacteriaceae bacterium]|jgi:hypothetical protein|nr:fibronectin type III domain-containing protein [Propionibacteriaceae bacterium]